MFFKIDLRDKDSGGHYGLLDWIYPRQALISQGVGLLITLTYIAAWRRVMWAGPLDRPPPNVVM